MNMYSVSITASTLEALRALDQFDLDLHRRATHVTEAGQYTVPGILSEAQIQQLQAAGYQVDVVADLAATADARRMEMADTTRAAAAFDAADVEARAVLGYMTAAEVEAALARLSAAHPDLVTLIPLPYRTWEGRTCHAVRLRAGTSSPRIGVLFTGSMHAREWGGADACIAFLVNLINAYRAHAPLVLGGKTFTAAQVRTILRRLTVAGSDVYKGRALFSEPETRNVRYLLDRFPTIQYYVDIHSFSELILYPWGDDGNQSVDPNQNFRNPAFDGLRGTPGGYREFMPAADQHRLVDLANRMEAALAAVRGTHYTVQQAVGLYPTSATSDDYIFSRHLVNPSKRKVYPFTIEFGSEFIPPFAEMQHIIRELGAAMTELCLAASTGL